MNKYLFAVLVVTPLTFPAAANAGANEGCKLTVYRIAESIVEQSRAMGLKSSVQAVVKEAGLEKIAQEYGKNLAQSDSVLKEVARMNEQLQQFTRAEDFEAVSQIATALAQKTGEAAELAREGKLLRGKFAAAAKNEVERGMSAIEVGGTYVMSKGAIPEKRQLSFSPLMSFADCSGDAIAKELAVSYDISTGRYKLSVETVSGKCRYPYSVGSFAARLIPTCAFSSEDDKAFLEELDAIGMAK
jgi:hypothetical protein